MEEKVLVVDVGGSHVKILAKGQRKAREFSSGPALTASQMVAGVKDLVADWQYDRVAMGYPGPVLRNRPIAEPHNLGPGWVSFNYVRAFGCPVKIINDAAMQALGAYRGGKMLFPGLGTGLGSAMVVEGIDDGGAEKPAELCGQLLGQLEPTRLETSQGRRHRHEHVDLLNPVRLFGQALAQQNGG